MTSSSPTRDVVLDLLAARSTEGLSSADETRLAELLPSEPDLNEDYFELAASAAALAVDAAMEPIPSDLRLQLIDSAVRFYSGNEAEAEEAPSHPFASPSFADSAPIEIPPVEVAVAEPEHRLESPSPKLAQPANPTSRVVSFRRDAPETTSSPAVSAGFDWTRWGGWIVAAAIAGFTIGLKFLTPEAGTSELVVAELPAPVVQTSQEKKAALVATAVDLRRVSWSATDHPLGNGVEGEVVWSDAAQEGYMTFRGLAWNDAQQRQYQLWVFDAKRSDERPVDGGVFDIPASSDEVIVPINAKIQVDEATLFAITLERPGGVVVSSREDLLLVAPVA